MTQIYVPIDYTSITEVIPAGDDILYSTLTKCRILGVSAKQKRTHRAHLLVTQKGLAVSNSLRKTNLKFDYYPWNDSKFWKKRRSFGKTFISCHYRTAGFKKYKVVRDPQFEDKMSFRQRNTIFGKFCKNLYLKANGM